MVCVRQSAFVCVSETERVRDSFSVGIQDVFIRACVWAGDSVCVCVSATRLVSV